MLKEQWEQDSVDGDEDSSVIYVTECGKTNHKSGFFNIHLMYPLPSLQNANINFIIHRI